MTRQGRAYRFATSAQWEACLFASAGQQTMRHHGLAPVRPMGRPGVSFHSNGSHAPVILGDGSLLWCDDRGQLYRLLPDSESPHHFPAPQTIATARRCVERSGLLWALSQDGVIQCFESDSLTGLTSFDFGSSVVDIDSGGDDSILALVRRNERWCIVRLDRLGEVVEIASFDDLEDPIAFVYLSKPNRFVVLTQEPHQQLRWYKTEGGSALRIKQVGALRPCYCVTAIASDRGRQQILLAGNSDDPQGTAAHVVILNSDGDRLGDVPLGSQDAPGRGIAAGCGSLCVAGPRGMVQFSDTSIVPSDTAEVKCRALTPLLQSSPTDNSAPWQTADLLAVIPDGATLSISAIATDDEEIRDQILQHTSDDSISASHRIQRLFDDPALTRRTTVFNGQSIESQSYKAPLFEFRQRYIWVCIELTAAPGSILPSVGELAVRYGGGSLMDLLPSIYRRDTEGGNSFLRSLVGVFETTATGIDDQINALGSQIHPSTAPEPWLDFVARWLGLPWDDALTLQQKRCLVTRAEKIAKGRGTRLGLETLLECISGGQENFRVTDATADRGFVRLGGESCPGTKLPAIIGGASPWDSQLDAFAVLGKTRLPCDGVHFDSTSRFVGTIRVEISATGKERTTWQPFIESMLQEMLPALTRLQLDWVGPQAFGSHVLDGNWTLERMPVASIGASAVTGQSRLPSAKPRLSENGLSLGTRLN